MRVLLGNGPWMVWNSLLALVPLVFAVFLFTEPRVRPRVLWWLGLAIFVAFLPNGPYVITDLIHLKHDALALRERETATVALVLSYSLVVLVGVLAYTGSLALLRRYLLRRGWTSRRAYALELGLHALCAVGVLLGRIARFNSWDLGTRPLDVLDHAVSRLDRAASWFLLITMFVVITTCTWFVRLVVAGSVSISRDVRRRT